jgi:hypothetical protein
VQDQILALQYVPSELQLADFFMKAQTRVQHSFFLSKLSLLFLFPHSIRGSLHITHTCTCIGLWPPVNGSCSFPNNNRFQKMPYQFHHDRKQSRHHKHN